MRQLAGTRTQQHRRDLTQSRVVALSGIALATGTCFNDGTWHCQTGPSQFSQRFVPQINADGHRFQQGLF